MLPYHEARTFDVAGKYDSGLFFPGFENTGSNLVLARKMDWFVITIIMEGPC